MRHEITTAALKRRMTVMIHQATCRCGWVGKERYAETAARIDGKTHRLETADLDDANIRSQR